MMSHRPLDNLRLPPSFIPSSGRSRHCTQLDAPDVLRGMPLVRPGDERLRQLPLVPEVRDDEPEGDDR